MILKEGVSIAGIRPELVLALTIAQAIYEDYGYPMLITSLLDGEHMRASLHYVGAAGDLRLPSGDVGQIVDSLRGALGDNYDVVLETDHIHIEFQPKVGA